MSNCKSCKGTGRQPGYEWMYCIDCGGKGIEKLPEIDNQSGEFRKRLLDARQKATEWCNLAMEMVTELRQDYPPGEKTELDGIEMIRTLRRKIRVLEKQVGNETEECDCLKDGHD